MNMEIDDIVAAEARDRAEWKSLLAARGLDAMAAPALPDFAPRVLAAARARERGATFRAVVWRGLRFAAGAAACAALLLALRGASMAGKGTPSAASWLASRQSPDGTWMAPGADAAFKPALTALAALALARDDASRHGAAIAAAVAALEGMQHDDGSFGAPGPHSLYNHAFATYALIDDARRSGKGLTPAISKAIEYSQSTQNARAAWDYSPAGDGNDALTVWQLGILAEARTLGWRDERGALRRGVAALGRSTGAVALDYRFALGRESAPASGGLALTRMATRSLTAYLDSIPGQETLSGKLLASLGTAPAGEIGVAAASAAALAAPPLAQGAAGDILPAIVALLERNDD